jgi:purine-cytosine permease-like protein
MRLKLVLIASLIASIVGTGLAILLIIFGLSSIEPLQAFRSPTLLVLAAYLLPVITIFVASYFVYRHTARRRRLQAALTALISVVLTLTLFMVASVLSSPDEPIQPPTESPRNST